MLLPEVDHKIKVIQELILRLLLRIAISSNNN